MHDSAIVFLSMQQSVSEKADFRNSKILGYNNFCMLSVDQAFCESVYLFYYNFKTILSVVNSTWLSTIRRQSNSLL